MKPQLSGSQKRPWPEAALSVQEEVVAAIRGALEVAVEMAIGEVTSLLHQAARDTHEELRRENESLKEKLQRAEARLDCELMEGGGGGGGGPAGLLLSGLQRRDEQKRPYCSQRNAHEKVPDTGVRSDPAGPSSTNLHLRDDLSCQGDQRCDIDSQLHKGGHGCSEGVSEAQTVKVENESLVSQGPRSQDSPPNPRTDSKFTLEEVTTKQEEQEEPVDVASLSLDSIKMEDLSQEGMAWKTKVPDKPSQRPNQLSNGRLDQAALSNLTTSLPPPTDLQSVSSGCPNIFQLTKPGAVSQAPPRVCGGQARSGRNLSPTFATVYTCKFCSQTFHLPSLLRRHYSQCPQRQQQRCQQPMAGGKKSRLQLYPPGCSPFCCTVCNREFNRMENLKTHLRIHTGERPYTCSVCLKCFRHSGALTRHFRIHTGEKPYVCGQCGKSFRNCGGLKFHQRSHSKQLQ